MLDFLKMHGLGNDFVILDQRDAPRVVTPWLAQRLADRHRGVGCDQVIVLRAPPDEIADAEMLILNADGSAAGACGNATRCVARLLLAEGLPAPVRIRTAAGVLLAEPALEGWRVDMGPISQAWDEIPLAEKRDPMALRLDGLPVPEAVALSVGNPHAVLLVNDLTAYDIPQLGPQIEHHPLFPERVNVGFAQRVGPDHLRLRVWERGSGLTQACGSGACAAGVAAALTGLTGSHVRVSVDGGDLVITYRQEDGHVLMTGPAAHAFSGTLDPSLLEDPAALSGAAGAVA